MTMHVVKKLSKIVYKTIFLFTSRWFEPTIFYSRGSRDYLNATLRQSLTSSGCRFDVFLFKSK
jgi:hypothetical protein